MKKLLMLALLAAPLPALAGNWEVAPTSTITFESTESGTPFIGRFPAFTADITFDPADLAQAKAVVDITVKGVDTGSEERDEELAAPAWFNVSLYPAARFETTAFRHLEGNAYEADGTLTIRDVSQPVTLPFTLDINGDQAVMKGEVTLDRTRFDLGHADDKTAGQFTKVQVSLTATRK